MIWSVRHTRLGESTETQHESEDDARDQFDLLCVEIKRHGGTCELLRDGTAIVRVVETGRRDVG